MNPEAARREYLHSRILSSSPQQLIEMLYEGALSNLRRANRFAEIGDLAGLGEAIGRVQEFIGELISALDTDGGGESAERLRHLYERMKVTLMKAHLEKRADLLSQVELGLITLLAWWRSLHAPKETAAENSCPSAAANSPEEYPGQSRWDAWRL